jgi:hypothetical protein
MDKSEFRTLINQMRSRRRMWVPTDRYDCLASFIIGCDVAADGVLLEGFGKWIAAQTPGKRESKFMWCVVVAARHWPDILDGHHSLADLPPELNEDTVNDLFELLDDYLSEAEPA